MADFGTHVVLCQSCGAANPAEAEKCRKCGALMPDAVKAREAREQKDKLIDSLPPEAAAKIRELEAEHWRNPDSVAICIQLSSLYKDHGMKGLAVEYLEKAIARDPANNFLEQKLRLLLADGQLEPTRIFEIERRQVETKRSVRHFAIGAAVALALVGAFFLYRVLFPAEFRVAKAKGDLWTVEPRFSSDGKMVAYLEMPRWSIFNVVDAMAGREPKGESWLIAKPIRGGTPVRLTQISKGQAWGVDYEWRPGHNEIVFSSWSYTPEDADDGVGIYSISAAGGEPRRIADGDDFALSYDGQKLAYVKSSWRDPDADGLYILDVDAGTSARVSTLDCSEPSWSPVSRMLVFQGEDRRRMMEALMEQIRKGEDAPRSLASFTGNLYVYDDLSGNVLQITETGGYRSPTFLADGVQLAALAYATTEKPTNDLVRMDLDGSDVTVLLTPGDQYEWFGEYTFSPDGKSIAFEGFFPSDVVTQSTAAAKYSQYFNIGANYISDIFVVGTDGTGLHRLQGGHKFKSAPRFSPDGKYLAYEVIYLDMQREVWAMKF